MNKVYKIIQLIARLLFGATFIFSGFVKAIDPLGTAYKVADYFEAFGMPITADWITVFFAFLLITVEFCIGTMMFFNVKLKLASILGTLFMVVMTPLTLYLAIENPVKDCGCFGDAIVLTNWETFYKNVALCVLLAIIFFTQKLICPSRKKIKFSYTGGGIFFSNKYGQPWLSEWGSWVFIGISAMISIGMCTYGYTHLPLIDFRPYKVGANIIEGMQIPEDAEHPEYDVKFIYAKDGVEKEFNMENAPYEDSTWVFVEQKSVLIKEGYVPPIHDFSIVTEDGDITDYVLETPGFTLLVISPKLEKADEDAVVEVKDIITSLTEKDIPCYWLTSTYAEDVEKFKEKYQLGIPFGATDEITLKTIVRANPGLVLLKEGTVVAKWHHNHLPEISEIYQFIH